MAAWGFPARTWEAGWARAGAAWGLRTCPAAREVSAEAWRQNLVCALSSPLQPARRGPFQPGRAGSAGSRSAAARAACSGRSRCRGRPGQRLSLWAGADCSLPHQGFEAQPHVALDVHALACSPGRQRLSPVALPRSKVGLVCDAPQHWHTSPFQSGPRGPWSSWCLSCLSCLSSGERAGEGEAENLGRRLPWRLRRGVFRALLRRLQLQVNILGSAHGGSSPVAGSDKREQWREMQQAASLSVAAAGDADAESNAIMYVGRTTLYERPTLLTELGHSSASGSPSRAHASTPPLKCRTLR